MIRKNSGILLGAGIALLAACYAAKPLTPLAPLYPPLLVSSVYVGSMTAFVRIDRGGHAWVVPQDTAKASGPHALFSAAVARAVKTTPWRPARHFGIPRSDSQFYRIDFLLLRDVAPLGPNQRRFEGNDTLPVQCPNPRSANNIVVCRPVPRVDYRVLH
jgi:hypothetical protein